MLACVSLRAPGQVAKNLCHQELETKLLVRLMPLGDLIVGIESAISHPAFHELISQAGKAKDTTSTSIKSRRITIHASTSSRKSSRCCIAIGNRCTAQHVAGRCLTYALDTGFLHRL